MTMIVEHRLSPMGLKIFKYGISYGAVAAMIISWSVNKSILWMLIDGWFSWLYVIFYALFQS
jgi:hypothetical protein